MSTERLDDASATREETEADDAVVDGDADQGDEDTDDEDNEDADDEESEDEGDSLLLDEGDSLLLDEDEGAPNLVPEGHPQRVLAGRIELLEKIGVGGMGTVWRGLHLKLERIVAVKILDEALQLRPDGRERFIREARTLARLTHRNVVAIHDCDELPDGRLYLCMELLAGETLRDIIKRREPVDPLEVIDVGMQVCDAVQAAHDLGVLHRDLTPANIIRLGDANRTVKVLDWGLCKLLDMFYVRAPPKYGAPPGARLVTPPGCRFGTPDYMAPEMFRREDPDSPSFCTDVYALAVVLYELLTGRLPFAPGDRKVPRPIRDVLPGFDYHDLEDALRAALRYRPDGRTQTMAEFREALELARECLLAQRGQPAGDSARALVAPQMHRPAPAAPAEQVAPAGTEVIAEIHQDVAADDAKHGAIDEAAAATTGHATSARAPEQVRVGPLRRGGVMPVVLAGVLGLVVGVAGTLAASQIEPTPASDPTELLTRLTVEQDRATAAEARADRCETIAATKAATAESAVPQSAVPPLDPPQTVTKPEESAAARVLAAAGRRQSTRRADVPRARPAADTSSNAMSRLESKVLSCARKGGIHDESIKVQVRRQGGEVDAVKVLKYTKDHPSFSCIDAAIRGADLPAGDRPVETFTFPK